MFILISWLQSPSAVTLESKKIICDSFHCFPIYLPWSDGTRRHDLNFWMLSFKPVFSLSSFTFIKRLLSSSSLSAIRVVTSAYLRLLICLLAILIPVLGIRTSTDLWETQFKTTRRGTKGKWQGNSLLWSVLGEVYLVSHLSWRRSEVRSGYTSYLDNWQDAIWERVHR